MASIEETANAVVNLFYKLIVTDKVMTINDCPVEWNGIRVRELVQAKIKDFDVNPVKIGEDENVSE